MWGALDDQGVQISPSTGRNALRVGSEMVFGSILGRITDYCNLHYSWSPSDTPGKVISTGSQMHLSNILCCVTSQCSTHSSRYQTYRGNPVGLKIVLKSKNHLMLVIK